jgi:hypothetical protein
MRKLITILFLLVSVTLAGTTYYVAPSTASPSGNDSNAGTIAAPWLTWGKAFTSASAGDTVYFRGGVYPMSVAGGNGYRSINDGTAGNLIYYWAYPSDFAAGNKPILDCGAIIPTGALHHAIYATANYCHFKGLTVRNVWGADSDDECLAWRTTSNNSIYEQCTVYNTHGFAFRDENSTNVRYINCDTYNNCDSLRAAYPGNDGYGFAAWNTQNTTGSVYYYGCRAWNCGDDGFVFYSKSYVEVDNCWSFTNGQMQGGGHGYKLGFLPPVPHATLLRKVTNSLAVYNRAAGFTSNDNAVVSISCQVYNNIAYHNGYFPGWTSLVYGFYLYNTTSANELELSRVFRNNISYANEDGAVYVAGSALYTHTYNSWDHSPTVTVSNADFVSVDSTGLTGARQSDGSLPDLNGFLHLAEGSDLIGAGIGVGVTYDADSLYHSDPPDLGPYSFTAEEPVPPELPTVTTISAVPDTTSVIVTGSVDGIAVTEFGFVLSNYPNPTTSDNKITTTTQNYPYTFSLTFTDLEPETIYHVRTFATNSSGTNYGNDILFHTLSPETPATGSGGFMKAGGKLNLRFKSDND